jgi:hypothetical protein
MNINSHSTQYWMMKLKKKSIKKEQKITPELTCLVHVLKNKLKQNMIFP